MQLPQNKIRLGATNLDDTKSAVEDIPDKVLNSLKFSKKGDSIATLKPKLRRGGETPPMVFTQENLIGCLLSRTYLKIQSEFLSQFGTVIPIDPANPVITKSLKLVYVPHDFTQTKYLKGLFEKTYSLDIPLIVTGISCSYLLPDFFQSDKKRFKESLPLEVSPFFRQKFHYSNEMMYVPIKGQGRSKDNICFKHIPAESLNADFLPIAKIVGTDQVKAFTHYTYAVSFLVWDPSKVSNHESSYLAKQGFPKGDFLFINLLNYLL